MADDVVLKGMLTKQGFNFHTWRSREFHLCKDNVLRYYEVKSNGRMNLKGTIDLENVTAVLERDETKIAWPSSSAFCFGLRTEGRIYYIYSDNVSDGWKWMGAIKARAAKLPCFRRGTEDDYDKLVKSLKATSEE